MLPCFTRPGSCHTHRLLRGSWRRHASSSLLPPTIRKYLSEFDSSGQSEVQIRGWVQTVRRQKRVAFAAVTDGSVSKPLQAVFSDPGLAQSITNGCSVQLNGRLTPSLGKGQQVELQVDDVVVIGESDASAYPIQKQTLSEEYLRDQLHLRPRTEAAADVLRLRDKLFRSVHEFFKNHDFFHIHTPTLTSNDCEGAGEAFSIAQVPTDSPGVTRDFFSRPAYLTVSSQLHLEAMMHSLSRVYTLGSCFRAERSMTNRHLAEFWMLEAEWAFIRNVHDLCDLVEEMLKDCLEHRPAVASATPRSQALDKAADRATKWPRITYTDAIELLRQADITFQYKPSWESGLQSEHERWLAESHFGAPVFVTDYPTAQKPFYMRANDDGRTMACYDLLVPYIGELSGGSMREERHDILEQALLKNGIKDDLAWYLQLRSFGSVPHGGFGLGFERLVSWISGVENVRECIAFPRWTGRLSM